jgi:O-antigen/teichoic acid export membrane protein
MVTRWVSLLLLIPGAYFGGLRGACAALLVTESTVLLLGVAWAWPYLSWSELRLDRRYLAPYLRFGLAFFGSNVLLSVAQQSGETLVRLTTGDYTQVGYFGLAFRIYLTAAVAIWQFTISFGPLLMAWFTQGKTDKLIGWVERLLKWLAVSGVFAVFSVIFLGDDLVPVALGSAYRPVAANLLPLMLALLTFGMGCVARLLALIYNRPGVALQAATLHMVSFVALGVPLVSWRGSLAGCAAVLAASALYAGYFTWRMRGVVAYSLWSWALPILLGGVFLPLAWLRSVWPVNLALFTAFIAGYIGLLLLLRIVRPDELADFRRALRPNASGRMFDVGG